MSKVSPIQKIYANVFHVGNRLITMNPDGTNQRVIGIAESEEAVIDFQSTLPNDFKYTTVTNFESGTPTVSVMQVTSQEVRAGDVSLFSDKELKDEMNKRDKAEYEKTVEQGSVDNLLKLSHVADVKVIYKATL
jgi:uncharacterized protein (DUF2344 family)